MTLGRAPRQTDLLRSTVDYCQGRVAPDSSYGVLHRECFALFPDGMFADLFTDVGRRSVPPMIVAVVMVLQRVEGLSDLEAVDRFAFDARWKYAAGGLDFDYPGSCTRCWWTCARGWPARLGRTGSSRWSWMSPGGRGWWGVSGCWTRPRCTTRSRRWTRSLLSARRSGDCSRWPGRAWLARCGR
ncbi:hypothetical protein ALI22I_00085 [Saccharothrix sp. ALI-22-I]|nr:hypothetical protein ALI22I_00085 [Saccharothrix sp. ALI-22-I]